MGRNYARFYILLNQMPETDKEELKINLVDQYTNGRTTSLKELTNKEYNVLCDDMQKFLGGYREREIMLENLRYKRSTALHLLQKNGIDTTNWNRVNAFCSDSRIAGKEFRQLTIGELDLLCVKLRLIMRKDNNKDYSQLN